MPNSDPMAEIKASFFIECEELIEALQDGLQAMETATDDPETIHVIFRAVHSIKGGAGAFGLDPLVHFAHGFETLLDLVRAGKYTPTASALKIFFQAADHLSDLVRLCRDGRAVDRVLSDQILQRLDQLVNVPPAPPVQPVHHYQITFAPSTELYETGNEPVHLLRNLRELGQCTITCDLSDLPDLAEFSPETAYLIWHIDIETSADAAELASIFEFVEGLCHLEISAVKPRDVSAPLAADPPNPASEPQANPTLSVPTVPATDARSVVRVDLERIERLINLVGELVINQAMLSQSLEQANLSPYSPAMNGLEEFQRLTRDIQDSVMMIRAQPIKSLFQRMSRIVRETSASLGKDVRLLTEGDATEVDKTVLERLADPLTHMIRNAVDHGLETAQTRTDLGKAAQGTIRLSASHRSGRVVIDIADDGSGIDRQKVRALAIEKRLIAPDAQLSEAEIDNLLFMPGFSTAGSVSELSGRGVGLDVVRSTLQTLGGRITIKSSAKTGTCFSISLPLTLAVVDGMIIRVSGETLVLPLNVIVETITLRPGDIEEIGPGAKTVRIRNKFVPLFDLGVELGYRPALPDYADCVVLLILLDDGQRAALVVDGIQDQRQVVIKGLDDSFYRAPGIAAATILGDGRIALILDPTDIIYNAMGQATEPTAQLVEGI
ncbi:MAG: chemotaxis protein CheA [Sulfitobacter sp.]